MKEIIFDLLSVGRCRNIMPEVNNLSLDYIEDVHFDLFVANECRFTSISGDC